MFVTGAQSTNRTVHKSYQTIINFFECQFTWIFRSVCSAFPGSRNTNLSRCSNQNHQNLFHLFPNINNCFFRKVNSGFSSKYLTSIRFPFPVLITSGFTHKKRTHWTLVSTDNFQIVFLLSKIWINSRTHIVTIYLVSCPQNSRMLYTRGPY